MITGYTQLFCIIADPVIQVRTPELFNGYLGEINADAVLVPMHVTSDKLASVMLGLREINNLRGIIVTVPHKIAIVDLCDGLHESARLVGAANVVRREQDGRLIAANFDGAGFVSAVKAAIGDIHGLTVFMAGAGGVARAIAFSIAQAGIKHLMIYNRSPHKADALLSAVAKAFPHVTVARASVHPEACDIAINATALGLKPDDPLPFSLQGLSSSATVVEVVMQPAMTPLLLQAQEQGLRIVKGEAMLRLQLRSWVEFINAEPGRDRFGKVTLPERGS